jgi:hypothetical protein
MRRRALLRFLRARRGATAVEFGLLCALFIGMFMGVIDLSRLAWEVNAAKAATRAGVRQAVVTQPAASALVNYDATGDYIPGDPVPAGASGVGPYDCTSTGCTGTPSSGLNSAAFNIIVARMQQYYPRVRAANVTVSYRHVGIGVSGNPCAPDVEPIVTVKLSGIGFNAASLQLFGVQPFNVPSSLSSMSGENLGVMGCF